MQLEEEKDEEREKDGAGEAEKVPWGLLLEERKMEEVETRDTRAVGVNTEESRLVEDAVPTPVFVGTIEPEPVGKAGAEAVASKTEGEGGEEGEDLGVRED